jgi:hypothetical protein
MRLSIWLAVLVLLPNTYSFAQVSLGDFARQQRAAKTTPPSSSVITNDDLLKAASPAFPASSTTSNSAKGSNKGEAVASNSTPPSAVDDYREKERAFRARYADQKREVERLTRELNVTEHEYDYQTSLYWTDAGSRLRENTAWVEKRTRYENEIAETGKKLNAAQDKLAAIEADARRAGLSETILERQVAGPDVSLVP